MFDLYRVGVAVRFACAYDFLVLFGLNTSNKMVLFWFSYGCGLVDSDSSLGWDTNLFNWDSEHKDGFRVTKLGMHYIHETKDLVGCVRKEYMMVYACYRFGLRFTLVKHRLGSWYDSHLLSHLVFSGFMRC